MLSDVNPKRCRFAKVAGLLFGDQNTATENNINKLVSRFNGYGAAKFES
jgi:hypothetical protein